MAFSLRRSRLGDGYYKLLRDHLVDPVTRWGLTPNQLSGLSMAVALLVPIGFAVHPFLGTLLMVVSALADSLDGVMARHLGVSSLWGGFVDTVVDQVSDSCYLTGIWLLLWHQPHRLTAMAALVTALVLMLLIGFIRAKSEALRIAAISMPM
ncbi:MAG: CDP-alcohol phosphatidyltransferase family protein, partial [Desulfatitalea sp.]|nr:CDP-alcohol phosphatidyltransferase family protein [Desulfatitalea sp.]NNJ98950.1 CDP-alcohol phosphatidyltransferase family protein [Desulfatitalea sp.]